MIDNRRESREAQRENVRDEDRDRRRVRISPDDPTPGLDWSGELAYRMLVSEFVEVVELVATLPDGRRICLVKGTKPNCMGGDGLSGDDVIMTMPDGRQCGGWGTCGFVQNRRKPVDRLTCRFCKHYTEGHHIEPKGMCSVRKHVVKAGFTCPKHSGKGAT